MGLPNTVNKREVTHNDRLNHPCYKSGYKYGTSQKEHYQNLSVAELVAIINVYLNMDEPHSDGLAWVCLEVLADQVNTLTNRPAS